MTGQHWVNIQSILSSLWFKDTSSCHLLRLSLTGKSWSSHSPALLQSSASRPLITQHLMLLPPAASSLLIWYATGLFFFIKISNQWCTVSCLTLKIRTVWTLEKLYDNSIAPVNSLQLYFRLLFSDLLHCHDSCLCPIFSPFWLRPDIFHPDFPPSTHTPALITLPSVFKHARYTCYQMNLPADKDNRLPSRWCTVNLGHK